MTSLPEDDVRFHEFFDKNANSLYNSIEEFVELMLEGAAQTGPLEASYARTNGREIINTCAFGAVGYAILVRNNLPITVSHSGAVADRAAMNAENGLGQDFRNAYNCCIASYNDEFGRDATIKALKDLL